MAAYNETELLEALRAIESTIAKCEKALQKLRPGTPQHTLLTRRIAAFNVAVSLIGDQIPDGR